ncbi:hypothetical protein AAKU58_000158 [Oxalobacteraceae bacterium GrIS 1.18]
MTTLFREALIRDILSSGKSKSTAETQADEFMNSSFGQAQLQMHLDVKRKEILNHGVIEEIRKHGKLWKSVGVNLLSGAIGAIAGPFVWGAVVVAFSLGQSNASLPETKAKELVKKIENQSNLPERK